MQTISTSSSQAPLISIITVVYNSKELIEKTIQSIIEQSYPSVEYIIIDGGSKDGTVDVIEKYADHLAYWSSEPDKGLYDAMNKGLAKAKGEYLWFINSGDRIASRDTLEKIFSGNTNNTDVYYGQTMMIDQQGKEIGSRRLKPPTNLTWKSLSMGMLVSHQSIIVKRSLAPVYDLQYRFSADFDWVIKVLKQAKVIWNTEMVLSDFLIGGLTYRNITPGLKERFRIMCINYGTFPTVVRHLVIGAKFLFFVLRYKRF